ncbi:methionyl-tRNA formyltransferase [Lactobacillaceae bacterium L1_55_11]|nr:methionyl-tRNA formyltransferase [Lactobacillaceae bacterium L1_55_11]
MTYRVVFMGTPQFAVPVLAGLVADSAYQVQAVVTQPDRPQGRKHKLTPSPVKALASEHNLPVLQPEKITGSAEMQEVIDLAPDFIITAAFGQFLPESLLDAAKIGAVNVHASLLPKYRGGAPVHYAIMNGDAKTGVTIMYMVKKMDAGDILAQQSLAIADDDNVATLMDKMSEIGRDLLLETLPKLAAGQVTGQKQADEAVSFAPNITRQQQYLNFEQETADQLDHHIRGLYPGHPAYVDVADQRVKLIKVKPVDQETDAPAGTVVERTKKRLVVAAANHTQLSIEELQPAGKAAMPVAAYLNGAGRDIAVGQVWAQKPEVSN